MKSDNQMMEHFRDALDHLEAGYAAALDSGQSGLAYKLWCIINSIRDELHKNNG